MAGKRLSDVAKGTWAVRAVPLRLANAAEAPTPGQPPSEAAAIIKVGVRVLLGAETIEVYQKAQELASSKGVSKWDPENPICKGGEMANAILFAVVVVDQETGSADLGPTGDPVPFFESVEQILTHHRIGTDNIAYLYEQWVRWQDACSFGDKKISVDQAIHALLKDMEAPDSPESPLLSMGHASLVSFARIMGNLWLDSLKGKSPSGQPDESDTSPTSSSPLESAPG